MSSVEQPARRPANTSFWLLTAFTVVCAAFLLRPPPGLPTLYPVTAPPLCPVPVEVLGEGVTCLSPQRAQQLGLYPGAVWPRGPRGEAVAGPPQPMAPRRLLVAQVRLDLQTASVAELEALPEIGPHLAQRIVAARQARAARPGHGDSPQLTRAELLKVAGIGEKKLERLLPFLDPLP